MSAKVTKGRRRHSPEASGRCAAINRPDRRSPRRTVERLSSGLLVEARVASLYNDIRPRDRLLRPHIFFLFWHPDRLPLPTQRLAVALNPAAEPQVTRALNPDD